MRYYGKDNLIAAHDWEELEKDFVFYKCLEEQKNDHSKSFPFSKFGSLFTIR
jgi:hypothetical protein